MKSAWTAAILMILAGCATAGSAPSALTQITIASLDPGWGVPIDESTTLRVSVDYSVAQFQPGSDNLSLVLKTRDGGIWEPARQALTKAKGRITFELTGGALLGNTTLLQPFRMVVALDRWETAERRTPLARSEVVVLGVDHLEDTEKTAKLLPPGLGRAQLLSDVLNDPRYKPQLPPSLNQPGLVVWGLFKVCVDPGGDVFAVRILKSADPEVNERWKATIRGWKHRPYQVDGKPVSYCYPMRLEVRSSY